MTLLKVSLSQLLLTLAMTSVCISYQKQDPRAQEAKTASDAIKLAATLVQVPVIVSEPGGRYVIDLAKQDFTLFEDGEKQEIEFFGAIDEPFNVALLIDSSSSTIEQLDSIKESALVFINKLKADDKVMLISFNDSVQILCELTSNRNTLSRAVRSIRPGDYTQVYEAVYTAVWERLNDIKGRKAVIIFSDGVDTASSEIILEDTLDSVIESEDVLIYPIRYNTRPDVENRLRRNFSKLPSERVTDEKRKLDQLYKNADEYFYKLAELSGGLVERADSLKDLDQAFEKIAKELRHQYLLGYYPLRNTSGNLERKIKVTVSRKGLRVRARPGYISSN